MTPPSSTNMSYNPSPSMDRARAVLTTINGGITPSSSAPGTPKSHDGRFPARYPSEVAHFPYGNARQRPDSPHTLSESSLYLGQASGSTENVPEITVSHPSHISPKLKEFKEDRYKAQPERSVSRQEAVMSPSNHSSDRSRRSRASSEAGSFETHATSVLPPLQAKGQPDENDFLEPLEEEDYEPGSFDLIAPVKEGLKQYSLETRSVQLFSTEHLKVIFDDPSLLLKFTSFLSHNRQSSIPILIYYLDAVKALKAITYANAIAEALDPIPGFEFTRDTAIPTVNKALEEKAAKAFQVLAEEDLPAYITHIWTRTVSSSITKRISGTLPLHLREASEGLAEVFCLTDPSRPDNPIVFASEEFHRTTQYGMNYVLGRNCRFLQGPLTNKASVQRIREKCNSGQEHCEVFLNYRRDGSPFMNLLMTAPLCDSRGKIRYFIGAQVDVSGLVKECSDLESLERLLVQTEGKEGIEIGREETKKDEFQELSEMLNMQELDTVRRWGGRMHREQQEEIQNSNGNSANWNKPRLLIHDASPEGSSMQLGSPKVSGKLSGVYEHYLLVRPYPSLRILFASPSLRVPGILQSPFMAKIGGSSRVRDELTQAMADGRGVTAKVRWVTKSDAEGRNRWIHCTPLLGNNGSIGVWMIVIVDDEKDSGQRRFRQAPPVEARLRKTGVADGDGHSRPSGDEMSLREFAMHNGAEPSSMGRPSMASLNGGGSEKGSTAGSESQWTLRLDQQ